jgi:hypothetical protein
MITKEQLASYKHLEDCIKETKDAIKRTEERPPSVQYGKVFGSSSSFPYTPRSFKVSGYNGSKADAWGKKLRSLYEKLVNQLREYEEMKLEIETFITDMPKEKAFEKLIFTYVYIKGMNQVEVAIKLNIDQSNVSKKITDYLKIYNESRINIIN